MKKIWFVKQNPLQGSKTSIDDINSQLGGQRSPGRKKIMIPNSMKKSSSPNHSPNGSKRNIYLSPSSKNRRGSPKPQRQRKLSYGKDSKDMKSEFKSEIKSNISVLKDLDSNLNVPEDPSLNIPSNNEQSPSKVIEIPQPRENIPSEFSTNDMNFKIVKSEKLLIPMTDEINMDNLKLCQKNLLPKEKNYFISEKNFKLLTDALNAKDEEIRNLNTMLQYAHEENLRQKEKTTLAEQERQIYILKSRQFAQDVMDQKSSYQDLSFQVNKLNTVFNKLFLLIKFILDDIQPNSMEIIKAKLKEMGLDKLIDIYTDCNRNINLGEQKEEEKDDITEDQTIEQRLNKMLGKSYLKNEKLCREYKKKANDYKDTALLLNNITEGKATLSDINKDMVNTKKRMNELIELNEKLEKENNYLRLSYQNLYIESQSKRNLNDKEIEAEIERKNFISSIEELKKENDKLKSELENLKNANTNYIFLIKEKDNIISELKKNNLELEKKNQMTNSTFIGLKKKGQNDDLDKYLNKSTDEIFNDINNDESKRKKEKEDIDRRLILKNFEIKNLKRKIEDMENENKRNIFFEGESENVGINGINYIGDMYFILYNQANMIEKLVMGDTKDLKEEVEDELDKYMK